MSIVWVDEGEGLEKGDGAESLIDEVGCQGRRGLTRHKSMWELDGGDDLRSLVQSYGSKR